MMAPRSLLPAVVALLLGLPAAPALAQNYVRLLRHFDGDKLLFCFEAPMSRVQKLPVWDEKGEPPLSRDRAVDIGAEHLRSAYPRVNRFTLHQIDLNRLNVRYKVFTGTVWYYVIEYAAHTDGSSRLSSTDFVAIVLFDGKPVSKTMGKCSPLAWTFAPNTALLTDTYTSSLRARHGAAERER